SGATGADRCPRVLLRQLATRSAHRYPAARRAADPGGAGTSTTGPAAGADPAKRCNHADRAAGKGASGVLSWHHQSQNTIIAALSPHALRPDPIPAPRLEK